MDDEFEFYHYYDLSDCSDISFPYPEEIYLSSWDRVMATNDDWIDTWEFMQSIKEVRP